MAEIHQQQDSQEQIHTIIKTIFQDVVLRLNLNDKYKESNISVEKKENSKELRQMPK